MPSRAQQREGDFRDVLDIDGGELCVLHGEKERPFGHDRRHFPEIHLHELAGAQVRPREPGAFEVALDFCVHPREEERRIGRRVQPNGLTSTQNSGVQGTKSSAGARGVLAFPFPSKRAAGPPEEL